MNRERTKERAAFRKHLSPIVGGKIVAIVIDQGEDDAPSEWGMDDGTYTGFIVAMPNGKQYEVIALRDPEGNGAGHLSITEARGNPELLAIADPKGTNP